ncbi:MAG: ATP-binding cassette domain-containing protein [Salaquimonas sp.]|nr:ATP-binding cassette domain-containing protein [Salaquimonas sp.]
MNAEPANPVVRVRGLTVGFGDRNVLENINLDVRRREVLGIVGGSGSGKSVLLRTIIGLLPKRAGTIELFGQDTGRLSLAELRLLERRCGVLFQQGALFSSLTVKQNIQFQMREALGLSTRLLDEMSVAKLEMVGLAAADGDKWPAELSGGMIKRAAMARALALDPEFVFLDEPTSGLDPISAGDVDDMIATLQDTLGLTVFMVTHDLDSLRSICNRIVVIADKGIVADGTIEDMLHHDHPWVQSYFRGRANVPAPANGN